ncbi:MAG TPA: MarR family transcriptional regulator [Plantibacter sp.]|uniref:MarR family winged helix-turn-helix transcriptional regulator n=1 Tax=unclassified Plantibacter TaxID=2624265 RepID=UPI002C12510F|nr:MarR family transcriptional regulator [Plantibacter sp.]
MQPAPSIAASLGLILNRSFRKDLHRELTVDVADGLSEATYPVLSALERANGPVSAATLAPLLGLDRSVVSRRAARLIDTGLITSTAGEGDRRQALLTLTVEGALAVQETRRRLDVAVARHIEGWTSSEREDFAVLLERFAGTPLGDAG